MVQPTTRFQTITGKLRWNEIFNVSIFGSRSDAFSLLFADPFFILALESEKSKKRDPKIFITIQLEQKTTKSERQRTNAQRKIAAQLNAEQRKNSNSCSQIKIKWTLNWQQWKNNAQGGGPLGVAFWPDCYIGRGFLATHTTQIYDTNSAVKSQTINQVLLGNFVICFLI